MEELTRAFSYSYKTMPYYDVNGKIFNNKYLALTYANTVKDIKFNAWDNYFTDLSEPIENINTLIKRRAEQLRDSYKYIRLHYSGGVDSYTALKCFTDNNIPLDEILISKTDFFGLNTSANYEIDTLAIPSIKDSKFPVTIINPSFYKWFNFTSDNNMISKGSLDFNTNSLLYYEQYPNLIKEDVAEIICEPKPTIIKKDNSYYTYFTDTSFFQEHGIGPNVVFFYCGYNCIPLYLKQAYMLKTFMKEKQFDTLKDYPLINRAIGREYFSTLQDLNLGKTGKVKNSIFYKQKNYERIKQAYKLPEGKVLINHWIDYHNKQYKQNKSWFTNPVGNFIGIRSIYHNLGT
jgi:hypothetical protein